MYADSVTPSMERALSETQRRRSIQMKYNEEHGIVPKTIRKDVREIIEISKKDEEADVRKLKKRMNDREKQAMVKRLTAEMKEAAKLLEFEYAAQIRDKIKELTDET